MIDYIKVSQNLSGAKVRSKGWFGMIRTILLGLELALVAGGVLLLGPSANPNSIDQPREPIDGTLASLVGPRIPKPIAVWYCTTSWYGEELEGQPTATGEIYDPSGATAAHPTLPLGSIVRVVNTRNHRSQVVRINDRGPYIGGRDLDVSYEVAHTLGFDQRGLAKVRLELLEVPSHPAADHPN